MFSFRTTESIWTLFVIIVLQIILLFALIFVSDFTLYNNIVHKTTKSDSSSKQFIFENENLNENAFAMKINSFLKRIQFISQEVWNYLVVFSQTINNDWTDRMLSEISDLKNTLQLESQSLDQSLGLEDWRQRESKELSQLIRNHIHDIQNPSTEQCVSAAQTIVCNHTNGHGFASGLHDIVWCLIAGYYSNRTVILLSKQYHYLKEGTNKWTDFFMPLNTVCDESLYQNMTALTPWPGSNNPVARRLIHYLPKSIGDRIVKFHSNPLVWWLGQFAHYIMRPQPTIEKLLNEMRDKLNFKHPIVGLHVRRTDKVGTEGSFHNISEYMTQIEDFYNKIQLLNETYERKVYLATDDPKVWEECVKKYPKYRFIGNKKAAFYASKMNTRYNTNSFIQLIIDIYLLSETDYIVCTMSSGVSVEKTVVFMPIESLFQKVCRIAFALLQNHFTDGGFRSQSIDVPFHYEFVQSPPRVAIYNHNPRSSDEWSLRIGDTMHPRNGEDFNVLAVNGKKSDSYLMGTDQDKTDYLKYPAYKTLQKIFLY